MKTILLVASLVGYGQEQLLKMDKIYYLLGTLDDYQGRRMIGSADSTVDRYYPNERVLASIIDTFFYVDCSSLKYEIEPSGHVILFSKRAC